MIIGLRDKDKKLVMKDLLDLNIDMSVENEDGKYYVKINSKYRLNEVFENEESAEKKMLLIASSRNQLEDELRQY